MVVMSSSHGHRPRPILHAATNPYRPGAARFVTAFFLSIVLLVVSTAAFIYHDLGKQLSANAINTDGLGATVASPTPPSDSFHGRALNILVVGIDSREGQEAVGLNDGEEGMRADTTMLMHVSADRTRIQVVSIPRDLLVDIPSCKRSDGTSTYAQYDVMFNTAFFNGSNSKDLAGGIACTKATTELLTGLSIDGFILVDFKGFVGLVDALGGVWYNFEEDIYDERSNLDITAGCHKLSGVEAIAFARTRYAVHDGSDIGRIGNQQKLVAAMMRELLSKNFISDLPALVTFTKQGLAALKPSSNLADFNTDVGLLLSVAGINKENIQFVTTPWYYPPSNPNRVALREPAASNLWAALKTDAPLPSGLDYTSGQGDEKTIEETATPTPGTSATSSTAASSDATPSASATTATPTVSASPSPAACPPEK